MPNKTPKVSVVVAVLNGESTLLSCLNSIGAQTYHDIEIICIDDGSTDNTLTVMSKWQSNHPNILMKILQNEKNTGLAPSLNRGITSAQGEYIARIDADDTWAPKKIEKQMKFLLKNPTCGVVGTFYVNNRNNNRQYIGLPIKNIAIKKRMFRRNPFGHSCVIIKKDILQGVGGYNGELREDRDLWFRLLHKTSFHNIPEFLVERDTSTSHFYSPKELRRNIRTVHTYIQKYHASPFTYVWLLEPIAVYIYHAIKKHVT